MQFNYILEFTCRGSVIALGWANVAFRERGWKRRLKMGWVGRTVNRKTRGMFQKSGIELDCNEGTCRLSYLPDQRNSFKLRKQTWLFITTQSSIMCIYMYVVYFSFTKELHLNSCPFKFSNFPFLSFSSVCLCSLFLEGSLKTIS